ncbi:hypothetical protein JL475_39225 [Streptomyces sp. M2CJ-2]|uniref:hypothetical protein n=1 Tax=Streptomyces sp. M2CJ-2 TaxID=2803948 RepID=UPI00192636DE|nr:hypothetical protein [Streptomyces sp. M2CJ-2]MBL3671770.1 hypothetical protein [Streptomyces sp. M2CJ-2]
MGATPPAGFAIQNTVTHYDHASAPCLPDDGCCPQGPWPGFAALCAYVAVTLGPAISRLRRRDV